MPTRIATPTHMATTLMDSYSEANTSGNTIIAGHGGLATAIGQSFMATAGVLDHCKFHLATYMGTFSGSAYAKLYSHSGVFGTSSVPGTLLATSDAFDVSTLPYPPALCTLTFSGANRYTLEVIPYVLAIEYTGGTPYSVTVSLDITTPTHSGNWSRYSGGVWTAFTNADIPFYVYCASPLAAAPTRTRPPQYVA